jgi:hypothetical protein
MALSVSSRKDRGAHKCIPPTVNISTTFILIIPTPTLNVVLMPSPVRPTTRICKSRDGPIAPPVTTLNSETLDPEATNHQLAGE